MQTTMRAEADSGDGGLAALRMEVGRLADGLAEMVDALAAQGDTLAAVLRAVMATPTGADGISDALGRIADGLAAQTTELVTLRRSVAVADDERNE